MKRLSRLTAALAAMTLAAGIAVSTTTAEAPSAEAVTPPRSGKDVIVNLFQWRWSAVAAECKSTIGPAGFGYVQVSPAAEHITGSQWWTSYQPVSYKLESKLGTRAEYAAMVQACHSAGVGVIADVVVNHMASGSGTGVAGSTYGQGSFPGTYSAADFSSCTTDIINYADRWQVQNCRLVGLQDLKTGSDYVRGRIATHLDDLVSLGVDGFRIDASKHVPATDLEAIKARMGTQKFWTHEVIGAAGEPIQASEYLGSGDVMEFTYARRLKQHFDGQIKNLRFVGDGVLPWDRSQVFVTNHDTERNGETMNRTWGAKYTLANVFMLSWPYGSPTVYSGYDFSSYDAGGPGATSTSVPAPSCSGTAWQCTQRWTEIKGMVGFHNTVGRADVTNWWDDGGNLVAYGRGNLGYVVLNNTGSAVTRSFQTSLPAGTYCDVVASTTCTKKWTVNASGWVTASVPAYGALAIHVGARVERTRARARHRGGDGPSAAAQAARVSRRRPPGSGGRSRAPRWWGRP